MLTFNIGNSQLCNQQNTIPGTTVNEFDWRVDFFDMYLKDINQQTHYSQVASPFYIANNSAQFNTDHFAESLVIDYEPSAGWEIIYHNFGTSTNGVAEPSFALYNRYTGLLRFFMYLTANGESSYQEATVSTYIEQLGEDKKNSALLESQNDIHHSIEEFDKKMVSTSINRYNESYGTWIVSEWLTHYDPCTCVSSMKLVFEPKLQNISYLNLNADGSANTTPVYSTSSNYNSGDIRATIGDIGTSILKLESAYKKGNSVYKSFNSLTENVVDPDKFVEATPYILKVISEIIPGAGAAVAVIGGLSTLVGSSSTKTLSAYSTSLSFELDGEEVTYSPYQAAEVYVPGSNHVGFPIAKKTIYDNILGIASIIETPKFDYILHEEGYLDDCQGQDLAYFEWRYEYFKLNSDIQYAINSNAGIIGTPKHSQAALYFDVHNVIECPNQTEAELISAFLSGNGLIKVTNTLWRTPYMDLGCLENYPVTIQVAEENGCDNLSCAQLKVRPYLTLALVLESIDGNEIGYMKSYKIKKETPTYDFNSRPLNEFLDVVEIESISYYDIPDNFETWGDVEITDVPEDGIVIENEDGSSTFISLNDGDPNTPDDVIKTDEFKITCGQVNPVSNSTLEVFCNTKYDPIVALSYGNDNSNDLDEFNDIYIYPNPTYDYINVELTNYENIKYEITNTIGVQIKSGTLRNEQIDVSQLASGAYIITLIKNEKLLKNETIIKL